MAPLGQQALYVYVCDVCVYVHCTRISNATCRWWQCICVLSSLPVLQKDYHLKPSLCYLWNKAVEKLPNKGRYRIQTIQNNGLELQGSALAQYNGRWIYAKIPSSDLLPEAWTCANCCYLCYRNHHLQQRMRYMQSCELRLKFEGVCQSPKCPVYCERSQACCAHRRMMLCYGIKISLHEQSLSFQTLLFQNSLSCGGFFLPSLHQPLENEAIAWGCTAPKQGRVCICFVLRVCIRMLFKSSILYSVWCILTALAVPNLITLFLLLNENELVGNFCAHTLGMRGVPGLCSSAGKVSFYPQLVREHCPQNESFS